MNASGTYVKSRFKDLGWGFAFYYRHKMLISWDLGWQNLHANHHGWGFDIWVWRFTWGFRVFVSLPVAFMPFLDDRD